ncbi:hypothetical protein Dimus_031274, partial [Dionaea muscipula]
MGPDVTPKLTDEQYRQLLDLLSATSLTTPTSSNFAVMSHDQATTSPSTSTTPSSTPTSSSPDDQSPSSSLNDQPTSFLPTDQPTSSSLDDQLAPLTFVLPNSISPPVVSSHPTRQT